ncbi:2-dehydropantoate 2-reductase [Paenibacillus lutimineralis]|uniref:2-dehydropantoate 2-reductase n=1 Tax=Paenibacillus lutimineralis TaxID=2707005 RepID=A0A3S9V421_9BACL|nr:2-dehydropantoate 2-reductase [Paenibacillus lutimineralis]AZS17300.1 2-dehydropantoate 2-reductase [Paenibacillus lutimineralis]
MRILVLGAGGVGGYFGGRLVEQGADVTFLVREHRKQQLEQEGLVIHSVHGDLTLEPRVTTSQDEAEPFDLILFSTKAYHLKEAMQDVKPFVRENTVILPLLNGVAHIPELQREFGKDKVIGGLCFIETTLNEQGHIIQTSKGHYVRFGEFGNRDTERIQAIEEALSGTKASFVRSPHIEQDIWHKYLYITTIAGVTTLMRAPLGPIRDSENGYEYIRGVFQEGAAIMMAHGAPLDSEIVAQHMVTMEKTGYTMKASMLRDMEKGLAIEGRHLHGYLLDLAKEHKMEAPLLEVIYRNLQIYEIMQQE